MLKQKEPARLAEARDALNAIVADPAMQPYHADAAGLLDFVNLRLEPAAQAEVLAARLTAPDRAQTPGRFQQALIDLRYYLFPPDSENVTSSATHTKPDSSLFRMDARHASPCSCPEHDFRFRWARPIPRKRNNNTRPAAAEAPRNGTQLTPTPGSLPPSPTPIPATPQQPS